ncbi:MAG: MerR family transcriptional regulator [Acutalibacteraceae bacterium]
MKTVKEVSEISGVSVRTLHYYDAIGLLRPTAVTSAGYRLYDDTALARLQSILFFRELEFELKDIREILDDPNFDFLSALSEQIKLLEMKAGHINKLIELARETMKTGVVKMDFSAFDKSEIKSYAEEAKRKWGDTEAYKEYEKKAESEDEADIAAGLMRQFSEIGKLKSISPDSAEAQTAVKALQQFITDNCYNCTKAILAGLGQMYTADERFRKNIDKAGGEGTAEFVGRAIEIYCR